MLGWVVVLTPMVWISAIALQSVLARRHAWGALEGLGGSHLYRVVGSAVAVVWESANNSFTWPFTLIHNLRLVLSAQYREPLLRLDTLDRQCHRDTRVREIPRIRNSHLRVYAYTCIPCIHFNAPS